MRVIQDLGRIGERERWRLWGVAGAAEESLGKEEEDGARSATPGPGSSECKRDDLRGPAYVPRISAITARSAAPHPRMSRVYLRRRARRVPSLAAPIASSRLSSSWLCNQIKQMRAACKCIQATMALNLYSHNFCQPFRHNYSQKTKFRDNIPNQIVAFFLNIIFLSINFTNNT
jgi:hypothetical protein